MARKNQGFLLNFSAQKINLCPLQIEKEKPFEALWHENSVKRSELDCPQKRLEKSSSEMSMIFNSVGCLLFGAFRCLQTLCKKSLFFLKRSPCVHISMNSTKT